MAYYLEFAGIKVRMNIPFPVLIQPEFAPFFSWSTEAVSDADLLVQFASERGLMAPTGGIRVSCQCHVELPNEIRVYHFDTVRDEPYACMVWAKGNKQTVLCCYDPERLDALYTSQRICGLLNMENLLLIHNALLLHTSFIRTHGQAVLFSAASGVGKSTQADLWEKYRKADILNGDRAALRRANGKWMAHGLPFAGSSRIYRNESAPIVAIIALRQAPENRIRPMSLAEAWRFLYPQLTFHHWISTDAEKAIDLLSELLREVPVYLLECRPDEGAVQVLEDILFSEGGMRQ